jgi:hypothetical protein
MAQQTFPEKHLNKIDPEFLDSVQAMDTEEIKKKILEAENNIYEIDIAKENDKELADIREQAKKISAPYRETKTKEAAKIRYCLYILEGRGIEL